jgi:hypothetical protein
MDDCALSEMRDNNKRITSNNDDMMGGKVSATDVSRNTPTADDDDDYCLISEFRLLKPYLILSYPMVITLSILKPVLYL